MAACVKIRGLPWSVTEQELIDFFYPIPVASESITLLYNHEGRPSGDGFVWLHESNMPSALEKHRGQLGSRYLEIFESNEEEYGQCLAKSGEKLQMDANGNPLAQQTAGDCVIRARGLPFRTTEEEVACVFAELSVTANDVIIALTTSGPRRGDPSGDAFIRFKSVTLAQQALNALQGVQMGSRYLELFASTESAIEALKAAGGIGKKGAWADVDGTAQDLNVQENRDGSGWIRLRGLPFSVTQADIANFVSQACEVGEWDVTIKYGTDGRPSGEAYIQVESEEAAATAQEILNHKYVESRYVEAFVCSYAETQQVRHNRPGPYSKGKGKGSDKGGKGWSDKGGKGWSDKGGKGWEQSGGYGKAGKGGKSWGPPAGKGGKKGGSNKSQIVTAPPVPPLNDGPKKMLGGQNWKGKGKTSWY